MEQRICGKCKAAKDDKEFAVKDKKSGRRQSYCRACQKGYRKLHYEDNRDFYAKRNKSNKTKARQEGYTNLWKYYETHPCVDCGETDPFVLQNDHVRGSKRAPVSTMIANGCTWDTILTELAKCEVRCANCHARKTAKTLGFYKFMRP